MSRLLLKPWDLTAAERERVMESLRTMKHSPRDMAAAIVGPALINAPFFVYILAKAIVGPPTALNVPLLVGLVLAPLPLVIVFNIRVARRRVPRAIRLTWADTVPPVCPACGYRIADLPDAEACPECGGQWRRE